MIAYLILGVYGIALTYITLFCVMQLNILYAYRSYRKKNPFQEPVKVNRTDADLPFVTVQLPIYNEFYVIARLIDYVAAFDYPKDRFEIHIIDDSTDETIELVAEKVEEYKALGFNIAQIRREVRQGFKAGALRDASIQLETPASGDTIFVSDQTDMLIINPAAGLATLTVTLPSGTAIDQGQIVTIASSQNIAVLTLNGGTINGAVASLASNDFAQYIYELSTDSWFRIG